MICSLHPSSSSAGPEAKFLFFQVKLRGATLLPYYESYGAPSLAQLPPPPPRRMRGHVPFRVTTRAATVRTPFAALAAFSQCRQTRLHVDLTACACRRVRARESFYVAGDEFRSFYVVRGGFFKTCIGDPGGREQVMGFFMSGDLMGADGMASSRYNSTAVGPEDSEVYVMPFELVEQPACEDPSALRPLHYVLAREIVHGQSVMLLRGSLAAFLLDMSNRLKRRGLSAVDFSFRFRRLEGVMTGSRSARHR